MKFYDAKTPEGDTLLSLNCFCVVLEFIWYLLKSLFELVGCYFARCYFARVLTIVGILKIIVNDVCFKSICIPS